MSLNTGIIVTLCLGSLFLIYDNLSLRSEKGVVEDELSNCKLDVLIEESDSKKTRLSEEKKQGDYSRESGSNRGTAVGVPRKTVSPKTSGNQSDGVLNIIGEEGASVDEIIESRAEARANEMVDEWRANRQSRREERLRQAVSEFAESRDWDESLTETVMESVYGSMDEFRALREEFRAEEMPREERREKMEALRDSHQAKLMEILPADDVEELVELLRPPHHRRAR